MTPELVKGRTVASSGNRYSLVVAQASGMVSVQARCNLLAAIALMESLAAETDSALDEIAARVVAREVRFGDGVPQ